jgi:hypothetical protein
LGIYSGWGVDAHGLSMRAFWRCRIDFWARLMALGFGGFIAGIGRNFLGG